MRSSVMPIRRLTHGRSEYARCPPSCWMLNPMLAIERPSDTASGIAIHSVGAAKTSIAYDGRNHSNTTADLRYIWGQSRGDRLVKRKYRSTLALSDFWNASVP